MRKFAQMQHNISTLLIYRLEKQRKLNSNLCNQNKDKPKLNKSVYSLARHQ